MIGGRAFDLAISYDESAQAIKVRVVLLDDDEQPRGTPAIAGRGRRGACDPPPGRAGRAGASRDRGGSECWVTKRQLSEHLDVTPRWIEYQQRLGLPRLRMGRMNRYRVSEVEAWLRDRHAAEDDEGR